MSAARQQLSTPLQLLNPHITEHHHHFSFIVRELWAGLLSPVHLCMMDGWVWCEIGNESYR
jgi:hypothetical protein